MHVRVRVGLCVYVYSLIVLFAPDMFHYASTESNRKFLGDVIVLANADGVMDMTISTLSSIPTGAVATLSVTTTIGELGMGGRGRYQARNFSEENFRTLYQTVTGRQPCRSNRHVSSRCYSMPVSTCGGMELMGVRGRV